LTHAVTAKETSAPNLQIGSLPTQVRFRARAVSNLPGRFSGIGFRVNREITRQA
jgi:hypothetical protein